MPPARTTISAASAAATAAFATRTAVASASTATLAEPSALGGAGGLSRRSSDDLAAVVDVDDLDLDLVADVEHVLDLARRGPVATREMCSRPSLPGMSSMNAPNGWIETTRPWYSSPISGSLTMAWMRRSRLFATQVAVAM